MTLLDLARSFSVPAQFVSMVMNAPCSKTSGASGTAHIVGRRKFADARLSLGETREDGAPRRIGQGG